jgi:hypothetical protein
MEARNQASQDQDGFADQVNESMGIADEGGEMGENHESAGHESGQDPLYVQKRLKQQKRAHEREMREMHARMADMQSRLPQQSDSQDHQAMNPYADAGNGGSVEEHIHKAVSYALNHRDMEEKRQRDAQQAAHVQKQYQQLHKHLDSMGDKYDDFHDVVYGDDTQFTPAMRDYSMTLPKAGKGSAGEVLYKLGKNPTELDRIRQLHPLDQASEMMKLSHALISGGENKESQPRPLGQIKTNPTSNSSSAVNEKTPIGSIRQRMKSGSFK